MESYCDSKMTKKLITIEYNKIKRNLLYVFIHISIYLPSLFFSKTRKEDATSYKIEYNCMRSNNNVFYVKNAINKWTLS